MAADGTNNTLNHTKHGGAVTVIGGELNIATGGKVTPNGGTQATAISDLTAITGGESPTEAEHNAVRTAINSILAALRGVGIIASA